MKESEKEIIKKHLTPNIIDKIIELLNAGRYAGICYCYFRVVDDYIPCKLYNALLRIARREYGARPYNLYWWNSNAKVIRIEFLKYIKQQIS